MTDLKFKCFKCRAISPMNLTAEGRGEVYRLSHDSTLPREVTFYCAHCGAANEIALSIEMVQAFLSNLSSDDPKIQKAIDDAKRGDYSSAIDEARRRFGF